MDINIHNVKKITKTLETKVINKEKNIDFLYFKIVIEDKNGEVLTLYLSANNSTDLEIIEETL